MVMLTGFHAKEYERPRCASMKKFVRDEDVNLPAVEVRELTSPGSDATLKWRCVSQTSITDIITIMRRACWRLCPV